jgi:hypothetical protein
VSSAEPYPRSGRRATTRRSVLAGAAGVAAGTGAVMASGRTDARASVRPDAAVHDRAVRGDDRHGLSAGGVGARHPGVGHSAAISPGMTFTWSEAVGTTTSNAATASGDDTSEATGFDSRTANDVVLQAEWSTASGSPTISWEGSFLHRVRN